MSKSNSIVWDAAREYAKNEIYVFPLSMSCMTSKIAHLPAHMLIQNVSIADMTWDEVPGEAARFDAKVDRSGNCHTWTAGKLRGGYGTFVLKVPVRKTFLTHRLAMERAIGRPLVAGEYVLHSCDNPACVRPEHLSIGTQKKNMQDAAARGRTTHGSKNSHARLTEQQVQEIRALLKVPGTRQQDIADRYGVGRTAITLINTGRTWKRGE